MATLLAKMTAERAGRREAARLEALASMLPAVRREQGWQEEGGA